MVAIDPLLYVCSAIFAILGFSFYSYPTSHVLLGYNTDFLVKFLASSFNSQIIVPLWAGAHIALSSICFYATTFTSAHDKAKVVRGVLFVFIAALQANLTDAYAAKQSVFNDPTLLQYARIGTLLALTAWTLVESFSAYSDDARPIKDSAKKNKHASTPVPINNLYLRIASLLWLIQGCLFWFAPSHLGLIHLSHPTLHTNVFNDFSTTSIGGLLIAMATIAGYGATFQSAHNQAKLARSFLLHEALLLCTGLYSIYNKTYGGLTESAMVIHSAISAGFVVWSLVVSFSSTSDDIVGGGGQKAATRKQQ